MMSNRPLRGALGDRLEVAPPDLPRGCAGAVPDAVVVHVDGALAQEVDRADDVVEVARRRAGSRCGPRRRATKSASMPSRRSVCSRTNAQYSSRSSCGEALPERVAPDLERLAEAVDVFGDAELGDPALGGGLAVALGVGRRVVLGDARVGVVGAQVQVVVGEHRGGDSSRIRPPAERSASSSSATRRSSGRGDLEVLRRSRGRRAPCPPALDQPGVVGRPRRAPRGHVERPLERGAAEDLRRLHRPQLAAVERGRDRCARRRPA